MNASTILLKAVQNNADWCDAVARAHGLRPKTLGGLWYCAQPMPIFFPNIMTLSPGSFNAATFNDLMSTQISRWCIRDSFADSQRNPHPFQQLFTAHWYFCESQTEVREPSRLEPLHQVQSEEELTQWIDSWGRSVDDEIRLPPEILDEGRARFVWLGENHPAQCGASLFFSQNVIGLTHLFGDPADCQRLVRTIQLNYPDRQIVGYGDQALLTLLKPFGFRTLSSMAVLVRA